MTNKDALEALNWINWKIEETYKLGIERVPVYETIRQALEVNQELVKALKEAVRLWDEHKATHEYHITSWKQALAKAES